jgi:hypothetical protein
MGFFDRLFRANLSFWDERAIGRGIVYASSMKDAFNRGWASIMREDEERRRKEREPKLALAREYDKSFQLVNRDAGQIFGGVDKNPMIKPLLLTANQRKTLVGLIDEYATNGRIKYSHAMRMKEYLEWMFAKRKPT